MSRLLAAARVRAVTARRRGSTVRCPLCEHGFDRFKDEWNRPNALCWRCGSHERHRAQWLLLDQHRPELLENARALLHFSPEWCLRDRLGSLSHLRYVTTDLDPAQDVELRLDVTATGLPDGAFDAVVCSHVLEHVSDDAAAIGELRRVTAPGGWCLVMVPLALDRATTYEDASITAPEDRRREFLQHDHVRLYAPDIAERLRAARFAVEVVDMAAELGPGGAARHGLLASDLIFLCRPA
ncbi:MAG TPA: class I SAM-dependent methyltransferase [Solirubrobacteraceae bacterium]|nr:class I SAM-dependent methyltransferase [Solirubrobacteraceae bacterium]